MSFYQFAGEHPFLTIALALIAESIITNLIKMCLVLKGTNPSDFEEE